MIGRKKGNGHYRETFCNEGYREKKSEIEDIVVIEAQLTIVLNNQKLIALPCSPNDLQFLAIGFLFSKGILKGKEEITKVTLDDSKCIVWVETEKDNHLKPLSLSAVYNAANSKVQSIVESHISVASRDIVSLVEEFQHRSEIFISTGGVHSVALCEKKISWPSKRILAEIMPLINCLVNAF